jgi:hypothetical protein
MLALAPLACLVASIGIEPHPEPGPPAHDPRLVPSLRAGTDPVLVPVPARSPKYANRLADAIFQPASPKLPDIAAKIAVVPRNRYTLGYPPPAAVRDGRYRKPQAMAIPPKGLPPLRPFYQRGYCAPAE